MKVFCAHAYLETTDIPRDEHANPVRCRLCGSIWMAHEEPPKILIGVTA